MSYGLSAHKPLALLSGNDIEHLQVALGAMYVAYPRAKSPEAVARIGVEAGAVGQWLPSLDQAQHLVEAHRHEVRLQMLHLLAEILRRRADQLRVEAEALWVLRFQHTVVGQHAQLAVIAVQAAV